MIFGSLAMLIFIGVMMWVIERRHPSALGSESSVVTLRDGLYWAIVTMTTVGYGDKTPKSTTGRVIAVSWMFASLVWVSLLSTSLVSRLTADRVEAREAASTIDLAKKKLAAVAQSSGAEYLDEHRLAYTKFNNLPDALDLAGRRQVRRGGQQRRRAAISDFKTPREHRGNAAGPAGAGLYGNRAARAQPAETADRRSRC